MVEEKAFLRRGSVDLIVDLDQGQISSFSLLCFASREKNRNDCYAIITKVKSDNNSAEFGSMASIKAMHNYMYEKSNVGDQQVGCKGNLIYTFSVDIQSPRREQSFGKVMF